MRNFESLSSTDTRALSIRSSSWLLGLVSLCASCQPSVNASAEGPVEPQAPPVTSGPAPAQTTAPTSLGPTEVGSTPASTTAPTVNPVPTTPTTGATTTGELPTALPTTIPSTLPTTLPTTIPTTFPTTVPSTEAPAPTSPEADGKVRTEGDRILLPGNIVFESGKTILSPTPENLTVLKQLQKFLTDNPKVTQIRIEGYTDNVGNAESNLKLSGERALAIKQWLVAQGIAAERVLAVGFGQEKPIADNGSPAGRAQNRRTEFKIATVNGRPYRGVPVLGGGTEFK